LIDSIVFIARLHISKGGFMAELLPIGQLLSIAKVGGGVIEFGNERVGYSGCIRTAAMNNGILELFLPTITQSWKYRRWALTRDLSRPIRVPGGLTVRLVSSRTYTFLFEPWKNQGTYRAYLYPSRRYVRLGQILGFNDLRKT
jgi:hypothetical protein